MYLLFDDDGILVIASLFPPHPEKLNSDKQILLDGAVDDGKLWIVGQPNKRCATKCTTTTDSKCISIFLTAFLRLRNTDMATINKVNFILLISTTAANRG